MQLFTANKLLEALRFLYHHAVPRSDGKAWHLPMLTHDHYEAIESAVHELEQDFVTPAGSEPKGLFGKYLIAKADGSPVDPDADYFVLRLDKDPVARNAALKYAEQIHSTNPELAWDLLNRVTQHEAGSEPS